MNRRVERGPDVRHPVRRALTGLKSVEMESAATHRAWCGAIRHEEVIDLNSWKRLLSE